MPALKVPHPNLTPPPLQGLPPWLAEMGRDPFSVFQAPTAPAAVSLNSIIKAIIHSKVGKTDHELLMRMVKDFPMRDWLTKETANVGGAAEHAMSRLASGGEAVALQVGPLDLVLKLFPRGMKPYTEKLLANPPDEMLPVFQWGSYSGPEKFGFVVQPKVTPLINWEKYAKRAIPNKKLERMREIGDKLEEGLMAKGLFSGDLHGANIGMYKRQPKIIDVGSIIERSQ